MSVEAISWALNLAPVPVDRGGQPSSACKFVLVALANHAGPDGTGAFPSAATLVRYTGLSERTVRSCLDRLEAGGIIRRCDPEIVAARIKRADRRPKGWDLDLSLLRGDLTEADLAALEHQFPGVAARVAEVACPDDRLAADGVQSPHPAGAVDNWAAGVQPLHPGSGAGCNERSGGVQPAQSRGAVVAPEPYLEPSREPSARPSKASLAEDGPVADGGRAGEFFDALGPVWRLTAAQRARLAPAVLAALDEGWPPHGLAGFTGANTAGVRNPYAVLAARLSPAELPPPPTRSARPPWCGECDQVTRMLDYHGDTPRRCPRCRPHQVPGTIVGKTGVVADTAADLGHNRPGVSQGRTMAGMPLRLSDAQVAEDGSSPSRRAEPDPAKRLSCHSHIIESVFDIESVGKEPGDAD
jgi:hypothetical protein